MKSNPFIVINGFSADAIEILAKNFNSLSKRNRLVQYLPDRVPTNPDIYECVHQARLYESAKEIILGICTFLGGIRGENFFVMEPGVMVNSLELLSEYHKNTMDPDRFEAAIEDIIEAFNRKARMFHLPSRLVEFERKK